MIVELYLHVRSFASLRNELTIIKAHNFDVGPYILGPANTDSHVAIVT